MKKRTLASRIITMILVAAMAVSLAACGSSGSESTGDGVLDCAVTSGLTSLTPFVTNGGRDAFYWKMTYESLGYMNYDKELTPWVATDWSTDDNLTYKVNIHDNVYDSAGNHITASDIVWFINEAREQALKPVFNKIEDVKQTGDYSFEVTLKSNMVGVFEYIMEDTFVISEAAYKASPDGFATECVTTNQYKVTEFTASSDWMYELRDDYWGNVEELSEEIRGVVPKVKFHVIAEASQISAAFQTGLVDYQDGATIAVASQMFNNPDYTVLEYEGHQGYQIFFSGYEDDGVKGVATKPTANDVYLRQAICYAIDNEALVDGYAQGHGTLLYDVCPSFYKGYNSAWENEDYYSYNPELAKEILAQSNYNGETLVILVSNAISRIGEIIVNNLSDVGIKAEIYSPESAQLMQIRLDGSYYDMFINTIGGTYLPDHWSIRYDPNAYATGDGTSRHDYALGELLYKTWTVDGYTTENINEVHEYLKDNAIAYGLFNMNNFCIYSNKLTLVKEVDGFTHKCYPFASTWEGI